MASSSTFSSVLDAALRHPHVPAPRVLPHVGKGLSVGVWSALERDVLPVSRRMIRVATVQKQRSQNLVAALSEPAPKAQPSPKPSVRWSPQQVIALNTFVCLGADIGANSELRTVKRAYWTLARTLHPDTATGDEDFAHQQFCRLQDAWEVLRPGPKPPRTGGFTPLW
ncbi:MAG: DnaJ domain-containing protein [Rhodobacterales bacterium]|nr:DnaJ domain-containing protein [Rhodobacterales bacterium]